MLHKYNTIDVTRHLQHSCFELNGALFKGARTYCVINDGTSWLPKNAIESCTIDKKLEKLFCASKNRTLTVLDCSTTCVPT